MSRPAVARPASTRLLLSRRAFLGGAALLGLAACAPPAPSQTAAPTADRPQSGRKPEQLWDRRGLDVAVLFQHEIDELPEAPYMLRVTELEMEPGASIDPDANLGVSQIVCGGGR